MSVVCPRSEEGPVMKPSAKPKYRVTKSNRKTGHISQDQSVSVTRGKRLETSKK